MNAVQMIRNHPRAVLAAACVPVVVVAALIGLMIEGTLIVYLLALLVFASAMMGVVVAVMVHEERAARSRR